MPSTTFFVLFLGFSVLAKLTGTVWLAILKDTESERGTRAYSYHGDDYPSEWPVDRPQVLLAGSNTVRFQLDTVDGAAEWAATVPANGLVYLGEDQRPFTISMFHQLKCLNILREELLNERGISEEPSSLARHCLNYLKQMVMCRGDINLEPLRWPNKKDPVDKEAVYECRDWEVVYAEVKRNQAKHAKGLSLN